MPPKRNSDADRNTKGAAQKATTKRGKKQTKDGKKRAKVSLSKTRMRALGEGILCCDGVL